MAANSRNISVPPENGGRNASDIQASNRQLILRLIRQNAVISRTELTERSGLKPATITLIVNEYLKKQVIEDCGLISGNNGRRVKGVRMTGNVYCTISIRITHSYYAIGLYALDTGCITVEKTSFSLQSDFRRILDDIADSLQQHILMAKQMRILGVSVGVSGPFDLCNDKFYYTGDPSQPRIDLNDFFSHLVPYPVYLGKSSDHAAYWLYGGELTRDMQQQTMLVAPLSGTLDVSIMSNGRLLHNSYSGPSFVDYLYVRDLHGKPFSASSLLSMDGIIGRAQELFEMYPDSSLCTLSQIRHRDLIRAYTEFDPLARHLYEEVANALAQALLVLISILSPQYILIGDELPPTEEFIDLVKQKILLYAEPAVLDNVCVTLMGIERTTRTDISLRGGCAYVIDHELYRVEA